MFPTRWGAAMLERWLICAMALGWAAPAAAGERGAPPPPVDTLSLLLRDDRAVFDTVGVRPMAVTQIQLERNGDAAALIGHDPMPTNLSGFERLTVPAREYLPLARRDVPAPGFSSFVLAENPVTPPEWRLSWHRPVIRGSGYRDVVRDGMANAGRKRRFRRGSPFDSFLTLRFDGRDETPVMGMRGAVSGAIWRKLQ